jgi:phenylalanyl-tRNA synthetase alpha subunit
VNRFKKTKKNHDIKKYRYRWADIEDDGSYDDLRSFIKEFCGDYIEFMPEIYYRRSYFPPIPPNTF